MITDASEHDHGDDGHDHGDDGHDHGTSSINIFSIPWQDLTEAQREAAAVLGFDSTIWPASGRRLDTMDGRRLHAMEQGVTLLTLPSFRYTFDIIDLVERVQHYIFDHLNETVVYRLPTLFEVLVRGHDPVTKMFDTTAFKQTYTSDLFVREGSELSSLRHRRQTGYHDHRTIEDHEHGSGDHIHVGDQVIGDAAYHEHGSGGLEYEHEHGSGDHLHIFEAIVTPTTADRHDHGLGPHNHTAGIAHNHFHFNGMTIRLPSTYDTASRASSAIEEVQNEPAPLDDKRDDRCKC